MKIEVTDNITLRIKWKKWSKTENSKKYIEKTKLYAKDIDAIQTIASRSYPYKIIRLSIPHKELDDYSRLSDNEHVYDYTELYKLIDNLKQSSEIAEICVEINENELGGRNFIQESIPCDILESDGSDNNYPLLVRLYPYKGIN